MKTLKGCMISYSYRKENNKLLNKTKLLKQLTKPNLIGLSSSIFHKLSAMRCLTAISEALGDETWKV
jgi:hypothetical protein